MLFFFLHLNPTPKKTVLEVARDFDFLGLFLIIAGVVCLLIGFETAQTSWSSAATISTIVIGAVLIVAGSINEVFTNKSPIIPPRLFKTRTTVALLISVFLHAVTFFSAAYYIPVYFQVLGSSATLAGVKQIPFSFGSALAAMASGILVSKTGKYRPTLWVGWVLMTLGYVCRLYILVQYEKLIKR